MVVFFAAGEPVEPIRCYKSPLGRSSSAFTLAYAFCFCLPIEILFVSVSLLEGSIEFEVSILDVHSKTRNFVGKEKLAPNLLRENCSVDMICSCKVSSLCQSSSMCFGRMTVNFTCSEIRSIIMSV